MVPAGVQHVQRQLLGGGTAIRSGVAVGELNCGLLHSATGVAGAGGMPVYLGRESRFARYSGKQTSHSSRHAATQPLGAAGDLAVAEVAIARVEADPDGRRDLHQ